jgi:hypothetical protein
MQVKSRNQEAEEKSAKDRLPEKDQAFYLLKIVYLTYVPHILDSRPQPQALPCSLSCKSHAEVMLV